MVSSTTYHQCRSAQHICEYCVTQYKTPRRQLPGGLGVRIQRFNCSRPGLTSSQETSIPAGCMAQPRLNTHTNPSKWMLCKNAAQLPSPLLHFSSPLLSVPSIGQLVQFSCLKIGGKKKQPNPTKK